MTALRADASALPDLVDAQAAARRIRGFARRTPLERWGWLSELTGADIWLERECWQPTRSFKVRGAGHAILDAASTAAGTGVVAASAGDHGQAVTLAAAHAGVAATSFVPQAAPAVKKQRIVAVGATLDDSGAAVLIVTGGNSDADRLTRILGDDS